ncbi:MAG: DUF1592 domain-containing protein [Lentisphaeraceae bacterium]|nr:DUF1592 domain-containing protein [Lentisphaeraceae bacterium]
MNKITYLLISVAMLTCLTSFADAKQNLSKIDYQKTIIPLLSTYCYNCHDEDDDKGDIDLEKFTSDDSIVKHRKIWELVVDKLTDREMPPVKKNKKSKLPSEKERELLINWIEYRLKNIDWSTVDYAGHVTIPRLNKVEYKNALRDLLNWDVNTPQFSDDSIGETGFSSDRDSLFMSDVLLDKYFQTANDVLSSYIEKTEVTTQKLELENFLVTDEWTKPTKWGYALGRGQDTVYSALTITHSGFYEVTVKAWGYRAEAKKIPGFVFKVNHQEVVHAKVLASEKQPGFYKFITYFEKGNHTVSFNAAPVKASTNEQNLPLHGYANNWTMDYWHTKYLVLALDQVSFKGPLRKKPQFTTKPQPALTKLKTATLSPANIKIIKKTVAKHFRPFHKGKKKEEQYHPSSIKAAIVKELAQKGISKQAIAQVNPIMSNYIHTLHKCPKIPQEFAGTHWLKPTRGQEFTTPPDSSYVLFVKPGKDKASQKIAASKIIRRFATKAFRRPLTSEEHSGLLSLYEKDRKSGQAYLQSLKLALTAVLVSPKFLYRLEKKRTSTKYYKLNDYELASRLSFFLWMSIPDQELMDLAGQNKLHEPAVLKQQVQRMIKDHKSKSFTSEFITQWMGVYKLGKEVQPDSKKFKPFAQMKPLMLQELQMFFESLVRENKSCFDIIDSNYTFVNNQLAQFYNISGVSGSEFKKVRLQDKIRGGVLGMGAVLTASSAHPTRTSPVDRGKWVLEELLGEKLPDPPVDIPPLSKKAGSKKAKLTFRQSLEKHQEKEGCAVCHRKIDPIGFGLQNFDNIGRWRTTIGGKPINSKGVLPSGEKFKNVQELKVILLNKKEKFSRNIIEKLLSFSLGRKLEYYDEPAIRAIHKKFAAADYKIHSLIFAIVSSKPFQFQNNLKEMNNEK